MTAQNRPGGSGRETNALLLCLRLAGLLLVGSIAAGAVTASAAVHQPKPRSYSDAELIDGFDKTVFGVESAGRGSGDEARRVKKWAGPVAYRIVNLSRTDRVVAAETFIAGLNRTVRNLRLEPAPSGSRGPGLLLFLVDRADYQALIRRTVTDRREAAFLVRQDCSAVTGGPKPHVLSQALVFVIADEGDDKFRHCLVEELTQSLGPVNDHASLADSIYNDDNAVDTFTVFDWFILNMLYDERVRPGMTRREARRVLGAVIQDGRARLAPLISEGWPDDPTVPRTAR